MALSENRSSYSEIGDQGRFAELFDGYICGDDFSGAELLVRNNVRWGQLVRSGGSNVMAYLSAYARDNKDAIRSAFSSHLENVIKGEDRFDVMGDNGSPWLGMSHAGAIMKIFGSYIDFSSEVDAEFKRRVSCGDINSASYLATSRFARYSERFAKRADIRKKVGSLFDRTNHATHKQQPFHVNQKA